MLVFGDPRESLVDERFVLRRRLSKWCVEPIAA
jgi:hypothetical protein